MVKFATNASGAICIPHICRGPTGQARGEKSVMWRNFKILYMKHVEKLKFVHMWINFKFLHMADVEKSEISFILCAIYGILLHFTLV